MVLYSYDGNEGAHGKMTAALILAANTVTNKWKYKPMDDINGASPLRRLIMVFNRAGIKNIVIVTGFESKNVVKHCSQKGVVFLDDEKYKSGGEQSALRMGLAYLKGKCSRVFVAPVYIPFFSARTVKNLCSADGAAVIPAYEKEQGYPALISESAFESIIKYRGGGGVAGALSGDGAQCSFHEVPDKGVTADARRRVDLKALIKSQGLHEIQPGSKVKLMAEQDFFGPGISLLLQMVRETGSLRKGALQMGVSYTKSQHMVAVAEGQLGFKVMDFSPSGFRGDGLEVTKNALELKRRYDAFSAECDALVRGAFERHFGDYDRLRDYGGEVEDKSVP